jgi:PIN domain nuclease of toxin-antitoxin system
VTFLLDTHLLLWAAGPIERLSSDARLLIDDPDNELVFSTASIWEVAVKYGGEAMTSKRIRDCSDAGSSTISIANC